MKTVVYLDILLLVNFLIGFLMVGMTGILTGHAPSFLRQMLGGAMAAVLSLSILLPPLPRPLQLLGQLAGCCLVALVAFGRGTPAVFLRRVGFLWMGNLLVAGAVILSCLNWSLPGVHTNNLQVYLYVSPQILFWASVGVYGAGWLFWRLWRGKLPQPVHLVSLTLADRQLEIRGMVDTGFGLRDDWTGKPVILLSLEALKGALAPEMREGLEGWAVGKKMELPGLRLLPCATVAGNTLLPAFPAQIKGKKGKPVPVLAAFTRETLRTGEAVEALLGRDLADLLEIT